MKKYIIYLLIGSCMACSDFLEPDSPTEYTPETAEHLNEMILSEGYLRYDENPNNDYGGFSEVFSDDVACAGYLQQQDGQMNNLYTGTSELLAYKAVYTWQPDYSYIMHEVTGLRVGDAYTPYYNRMVGVNVCFDLIDKVSGTKQEKAYVLAQAYALRAFHYLTLVNLYGAPYNENKNALGVPIRTTAEVEDKAFYRNTVEEVYERILQDALEAEKCFTEVDETLHFKKDYRVNLPMVQLLLARIYLYMENWEKAAEYAEKVLAWDEFTLVNLNQLSTPVGNTGLHNFMSYANSVGSEAIWVFGNISEAVKLRKDKIVNASGDQDPVPMFLQASNSLINSYEEGDLRLVHYIAKEIETTDPVGVISGYRAYGKIAVSNDGMPLEANANVFGRAFRLPEAYLIVAEANAMLYKENGNATAGQRAVELLNKLRQNRIHPDVYQSVTFNNADNLVTFVREERRRELCFENHRWFDLRRWGMPAITRVWVPGNKDIASPYEESYTLQEKDNAYTLPLPYVVMQNSTNLEQNPLAPARKSN